MVEHQAWVVAEPSRDGDPERIVVATRDAHDDEFEAQREESRVVIRFEYPDLDDVRASLASVSEHLDRLLFVAAVEWGNGATQSWLYEPGEGSLGEPVASLETRTRLFVESHFDYYAGHYEFDAGF